MEQLPLKKSNSMDEHAMTKTITLRDGHTIPRIGYGLWQISNAQIGSLFDKAIDAGYRHFDSAQVYFNEAGLGRAIEQSNIPREELFITSKIRGRDMGYASTLHSFDESMKKLNLDYLDLFLIHWPIPIHGKYVETWKALIELKNSGWIRSIGVSNFTAEHINRLINETGVVPSVNQLEIHPFFQQQDIRAHHKALNIVIESYSPLGSNGTGVLKHSVVTSIAAKHKRSAAQIVLRWHLVQGLAPLPRTSKAQRLAENMDVWDFALDEIDMVQLQNLDQRYGNTQPLPDDMNSSF